jgi:DNA-binding MarR family transcriptional regulator
MGGLNLTQISCLATIGREGPLPLGEVASRENLSAPFVTKIVTKLEDLGLVERAAVPGDRRVSMVSTTSDGKALLEEVRTRRTAYLNRRLSRLDSHEIEALIAALPILERLATEDETPR